MKRFLIVFVSIVTLLAFFSSALAIDRAPKESKAKEKEKPAELKKYEKMEVKEGKAKGIISPEKKSDKIKGKGEGKIKGTAPEKLTKWRKSWEKQKAKEKYDYFIDKNNNGIDDRLERKSRKSISPPAIRPVPKEKQPTKPVPSIKETDKKKNIKEAPKEKEVKKAKRIEGKKRR